MAQQFIRKQAVIVNVSRYRAWYEQRYPHHACYFNEADTHIISVWHSEENERKKRVLVADSEGRYEGLVPMEFVTPAPEETFHSADGG